ncbi:uncharacterized protein GVI51_G03795 [Nakaseomyces glabratus]|uniref:Uncharacterized protein n=1 Tax=Candida glabrata (strain ATCC 2001 / BCRC 20586 / JCM 3761 / NBRC 0622 / NRRL Y-65 / CBS 138) TaxID=284593 RepID=Q6FTB0_CANGA|nr:uncharacterized protein CAGL0G03949g [Nakaseomyces glabratus]KAH7586837.1 hypothetical protein J7298_01795 [Nakaseomyces glabratus]KAH7602287.1 hypothetical protein J7295_01802 [Nakaseomyces glabratus]KAH7603287.1 hypothetical protein J7294_01787 [Nakaseomyces glabratus]KAH7606810.1 hypothetical protein J7293_01783 [Nakaseomyces glabratus]KAH7613677.1 hypothetical protein J7292_01777 [Nakaseomyces glabratus]|eukprot:XP_446534.1 uncharacterized protein CAGL0G03949g [[Candida] glabrata]
MHVRNGPATELLSTRRCFSSVYRVVYVVCSICYTPDRELYGSVMQAEFLFCLRYVSLSEWFHWNSVRDGEVGAEEDNGPPRLSYLPMRKKSNGSVSTHKTYGIILRERELGVHPFTPDPPFTHPHQVTLQIHITIPLSLFYPRSCDSFILKIYGNGSTTCSCWNYRK